MVGPDWLTLLVDGRYVTQARQEAVGAEVFEFRIRVEGIESVARRQKVGAVDFESQVLTVDEYLRLQEKLSGVTLRPLSGELQSLRAVKDDGEIGCIAEAARIASKALADVLAMVRPGVREKRSPSSSNTGCSGPGPSWSPSRRLSPRGPMRPSPRDPGIPDDRAGGLRGD
jgi:Xaa-Pro aminopeptidase